MNPNLQKQQEEFKKVMLRQQAIVRPSPSPQEAPIIAPSPVPSSASSGRHINSVIHAIITLLKSTNGMPVTLQRIQTVTGFDLAAEPTLLDRLLRNEHIVFEEHQRTLAMRQSLPIKNKEELLQLLKSQRNGTPLEINELKETTPLLEDMAMELADEHKAFVFKPREDSSNKLIFLNDYPNYPNVDSILKRLWTSTDVPADTNQIVASLEKSGMRPHSKASAMLPRPAVQEERTNGRDKKPVTKRPFRKIKITNDYLEDIDLNLA